MHLSIYICTSCFDLKFETNRCIRIYTHIYNVVFKVWSNPSRRQYRKMYSMLFFSISGAVTQLWIHRCKATCVKNISLSIRNRSNTYIDAHVCMYLFVSSYLREITANRRKHENSFCFSHVLDQSIHTCIQ